MKKYLPIVVAALFVLTGCEKLLRNELIYLHNQVDELNGRLEELCRETNENLSALSIIVKAVEDNDFVENVIALYENGVLTGYELTFSKNGKVTIYNGRDGKDGQDGQDGKDGKDGIDGADGKDGVVPSIGVQQDTDGVWYWIVDGKWLLDQFGNKIRASANDGKDGISGSDGSNGKDGITPMLKITDGYWYISYDKGASWTKLGRATGENGAPGKDAEAPESIFSDISIDDNCINFTLADGQVITIGRGADLKIEFEEISGISCAPGATVRIAYTLSGADTNTELQCIAERNWKARIEAFDTSSGNVVVTAPEPMTDGKVLVFVSSGDGRTYMTALSFVEGRPMLEQNKYNISWKGGNITLSARTREDLTVKIPDAYTWISVVPEPETKAAERIENIVLKIEVNNKMTSRSGIVELYNSIGEKLETVEIFQYGNTTSSAFIVFQDDEVKRLCCLKYDTNGDGELSFDEAASVTSINETFRGCCIKTFNELKYFTGLTEIPHKAFFGCSSLYSITLPPNVTRLGGYAFAEAQKLLEIIIPEGVMEFGTSCFKNCYVLRDISFPKSLQIIGGGCFAYCRSLKSICIPDGVLYLDAGLEFEYCRSVTSVVIGSGLMSLSDETFRTCESIKEVIIRAIYPPAIIKYGSSTNKNPFIDSHNSGTLQSIKVPNSSVEAYKTAPYWKELADIIVPIE